jgi:hypothetical protein
MWLGRGSLNGNSNIFDICRLTDSDSTRRNISDVAMLWTTGMHREELERVRIELQDFSGEFIVVEIIQMGHLRMV